MLPTKTSPLCAAQNSFGALGGPACPVMTPRSWRTKSPSTTNSSNLPQQKKMFSSPTLLCEATHGVGRQEHLILDLSRKKTLSAGLFCTAGVLQAVRWQTTSSAAGVTRQWVLANCVSSSSREFTTASVSRSCVEFGSPVRASWSMMTLLV